MQEPSTDGNRTTTSGPRACGWYSETHNKSYGRALYETPTGGQVWATDVRYTEDPPAWPDAVSVGPVTKYVRREEGMLKDRDSRSYGWGAIQPQHVARAKRLTSEELRAVRREACICEGCGGPGTYTCTRCEKARYCNKDCQKVDWAVHKPCCVPVGAQQR
jgi:hypothetical protein